MVSTLSFAQRSLTPSLKQLNKKGLQKTAPTLKSNKGLQQNDFAAIPFMLLIFTYSEKHSTTRKF